MAMSFMRAPKLSGLGGLFGLGRAMWAGLLLVMQTRSQARGTFRHSRFDPVDAGSASRGAGGLQPSASSFSFARLPSTRGPITASMVVKAVVTLVKYDMPPEAAQRSSVPSSCGLRSISSTLVSW
jgi:hypothetical protein